MRRLRELVLWVGAALGLLAIAAGLAVAFGGFSFLIFRSGSMAPEIPTGGIALSRTVQAADIEPGDVVSVTAATGERITHRVVSTTLRGDEASLVLKGDANATEDSEIYVVTSAERVIVSAPYGGYVIAHALTPPGLLALGAFSLMLIALTGGRHEDEDDDVLDDDDDDNDDVDEDEDEARRGTSSRPRHRDRLLNRRKAVAGGALLAVVAGTGATGANTTGTWATFTDSPRVSTGSYSAASMGASATPVVSSSSNSAVTFTWSPTSVGGTTATKYEVVRYDSATATTGTVACATTAPTLTCTDTSPVAGTTYYGLRARIGGDWTSDSVSRATYVLDVSGPVIAFGRPADGSTNSYLQVRSSVAGCTPAGIACGTSTDPSGISQVEYTLRRTAFAGSPACWNGSDWDATTSSRSCTYRAAIGTSNWAIPGTPSEAYVYRLFSSYDYTLTVRVTDRAGNVTMQDITYTSY